MAPVDNFPSSTSASSNRAPFVTVVSGIEAPSSVAGQCVSNEFSVPSMTEA